jgi:hypothetical protein
VNAAGSLISTASISSNGFDNSPTNPVQIVSGSWEFSNDGSTVAATWAGNFDSGFDPDDPLLP